MTEQEKMSYALGAAIGSNYAKTNITFDGNALAKGFNDVINNGNLAISPDEIQGLLEKMQESIDRQNNTSLQEEKKKVKPFSSKQKKGRCNRNGQWITI